MRHGVSPRGTTAQMTDGYYRDSEAATSDNLLLCTYRWYDPATARWLTRDPIGYAGGSNLYGYVGGNPVGGVDPWGLKFSYVESKRDPNFWPKIVALLNHLADSPTASKIIGDCQKDPDRIYVFHRRTSDPQVAHVSEIGQGSTGTYHIYFDPDRNGILVTGSGQALDTPAEVVLIHELGHVNGQTGGVGYPDPGNGTRGATCAPGDVVFEVENRVRRDLGLPNRPDY
jgi:RHS repeat-associated protein